MTTGTGSSSSENMTQQPITNGGTSERNASLPKSQTSQLPKTGMKKVWMTIPGIGGVLILSIVGYLWETKKRYQKKHSKK